ncbi:MAG: insulinase family protein [Planctomycetia bacterium]|nr:insulinase family protein [Planctomycetia bacterium]
MRHHPGSHRSHGPRIDPKHRHRAWPPGPWTGNVVDRAGAGRISTERRPPGFPRGHRREHRGPAALPAAGIPPHPHRLQGGRWIRPRRGRGRSGRPLSAAESPLKQSLFSTTLDNGIVLLGESLPGLESVAIAFHTPAGAVHDGPGRCGLAALAGEMMLRGAGGRTSREIVEQLEGAGVQWSQAVSTSHASFSAAMVARQLPTALPIYADILRRPLLPSDQLENARQLILQTLAGTEDDPAHRVMAALKQMQYPAPWGMPPEGISAEVESLGVGDVRSFVAAHVQPVGTIIAIAGRIDWDDFVGRASALFGDWATGAAGAVAAGDRGPRVRHVPHDSQQTHIAVSWSSPPYNSDASYEASAALAILGGGSSSRLFSEVRERRGLCYSVAAGYHTLRDVASAICYSGTTASRAQETLDVILAEIARLPGTIEASEIERVKARAKSALVMQQESSAARAGSIARQWYHLGEVRTLAAELARYDRLDVDSVEAWLAANRPRDLSVASLGREPLEVPLDVSA